MNSEQKLAKLLETGVWFFDLDDTLISTLQAHEEGVKAIGRFFRTHLSSENAEGIEEGVRVIYERLFRAHVAKTEEDWAQIAGGHKANDALIDRIRSCQPDMIRSSGQFKKWSREVFVKMAADDLGVSVTPEQVAESVDAYWNTLSDSAIVFDDAKRLLEALRERGRKIYVVTASDARLHMQQNGTFIYDPAHSAAFKQTRIERMVPKGLLYDGTSIGDPEDKPSKEFFEKAVALAKKTTGEAILPEQCVMVGDAYAGDLQTPREKMNFGLVILIDRHSKPKTHAENYMETNDLSSLFAERDL